MLIATIPVAEAGESDAMHTPQVLKMRLALTGKSISRASCAE